MSILTVRGRGRKGDGVRAVQEELAAGRWALGLAMLALLAPGWQ